MPQASRGMSRLCRTRDTEKLTPNFGHTNTMSEPFRKGSIARGAGGDVEFIWDLLPM